MGTVYVKVKINSEILNNNTGIYYACMAVADQHLYTVRTYTKCPRTYLNPMIANLNLNTHWAHDGQGLLIINYMCMGHSA